MDAFIADLEELTIYIAILLMTLYGLVLGYHWFRFGSSKKMSTTAMMIYVGGSVVLIGILTLLFNLQ